MLELFISAFVTFFVVIDPPGCAPIYASMTGAASAKARRDMAVRAIVISSVILGVFAVFGNNLLGALGITLDSFRIAGGIMLFIIALEMVFEKRTQRREDRAQQVVDDAEVEDVSVFPMAMPMIAGPGSIATIMLLFNEYSTLEQHLVIGGALLAVLVLTLLALLAAGPLLQLMGQRLETVITRLLGVILAALAAQFVIDGLKASFA
ncbi:MAG: MarC family protein [Pseudomonadota bacterium]